MRRTVLTFGVVLATSVGSLGAQPDPGRRPPPPDDRRQGAEQGISEEALRARLEKIIERGSEMLARHEQALEQLDAGASPAEVVRTLRVGFQRDAEPRSEASDRARPAQRGSRTGEPGAASRERESRADSPPWRASGDELPPEVRQRVRAFVRENLPWWDGQLSTIEEVDERASGPFLDQLAPRVREILELRQSDEVLSGLKLDELRADIGVMRGGQQLRSAVASGDEDAIAAAEQGLMDAMGTRFDTRIALQEHEVNRLATRIEMLRERIEKQRRGREEELNRSMESTRRRMRRTQNRSRDD